MNDTSSTIPAAGIARDDSSTLWSTAAGLEVVESGEVGFGTLLFVLSQASTTSS